MCSSTAAPSGKTLTGQAAPMFARTKPFDWSRLATDMISSQLSEISRSFVMRKQASLESRSLVWQGG